MWKSGLTVASLRIVAAWDADQLAKNAAERSAHDVAGFVWRKVNYAGSAEMKPESIEFEGQGVSIAPIFARCSSGLACSPTLSFAGAAKPNPARGQVARYAFMIPRLHAGLMGGRSAGKCDRVLHNNALP
jgi:hypothetical protein